jgi:hypothetical protein
MLLRSRAYGLNLEIEAELASVLERKGGRKEGKRDQPDRGKQGKTWGKSALHLLPEVHKNYKVK